jgi:putative ABC transport system ATP-binding protein
MIECKNISKIYKIGNVETVAVKQVSLSIRDGEFVAIMGPSGSGKSTLMHILGVLDTPTSGEYYLDNKDVSKLSEEELTQVRKKKIGFVFQSFFLLPRTTVLRNVILPLLYTDTPREQRDNLAKTALLKVGLDEEHFSHLSNQLSGGQMQRVAIARALINNPSLILADEPTGNLDTKTGEMILATFQNLHEKQHHTIVLITHDQYIAEHANRIIHIRDGVILSDETNGHKKILNHS